MQIGLHYEGNYDSDPFKEVVRNIISNNFSIDVQDVVFKTYPAEGNLIPRTMNVAATIFFDTTPNCNFAIFLTDEETENQYKTVSDWVKKYSTIHPDRCILIARAKPKFEQWFFDEMSSLSRVFNLRSGQLPYSIIKDPKKRLLKIITEKNRDVSKLPKHFYIDIAKGLNITTLIKNVPSFRKFCYQLIAEVKRGV